MKNNWLFKIASSIYFFFGLSHNLLSFFLVIPDVKRDPIYALAKNYLVSIFYFSRSLWLYLNGFSYAMGFLMMFIGILNFIIIDCLNQLLLAKRVLLLNIILCCCLIILSIIYFNPAPILGFAVSATLFTYLFIKVHS